MEFLNWDVFRIAGNFEGPIFSQFGYIFVVAACTVGKCDQ